MHISKSQNELSPLFQVSVNGDVYNVGTIVYSRNNFIVGIVIGILAALALGAVLAYAVMTNLRKRNKGKLIRN